MLDLEVKAALTGLVLVLLACGNDSGTKKDPGPPAPTTATSSAKPSATTAKPATTPAPTASAAPTDDDGDEDDDEEEGKDFACGEKGEPRCPMQKWMKANIAKSVSSGDLGRIAKDLQFIADHPVEEYEDWTKMAEEGVAAAKADDLKGAKKSCKTCHKAYQKKWRKTRRDEPWP